MEYQVCAIGDAIGNDSLTENVLFKRRKQIKAIGSAQSLSLLLKIPRPKCSDQQFMLHPWPHATLKRFLNKIGKT